MLTYFHQQVNLFMWDIFKSLTLDDRGILKAQLQESDWDHLRQNAFHITDSNINVSNTFCQKVSDSSVSFCKIEKNNFTCMVG